MWDHYYSPTTVDEVLDLLAKHGTEARLIGGGTDLIVEMKQGLRSPTVVIDVTRVPGLDTITRDTDGRIHLGPLVTHNQVIASDLCVSRAYPLAMACCQIGSPQIRNRGTVAGNLVTASPANDTIAPLWALDASVTLQSLRGKRTLTFDQFFLGARQTVLDKDEMLMDIAFSPMSENQRGVFLKMGLRRAQAIAVINVAAVLTFDGSVVSRARLTLGSVAPTILRAHEAEAMLVGKRLDEAMIQQAAQLAAQAASPIDDIRAPAAYRRRIVSVYTARALRQLWQETERDKWPQNPACLWGKTNGHFPPNLTEMVHHPTGSHVPIMTTVNGQHYTIYGVNDKSLLRLLREDIGLTGAKEGCAEGECGACTVWLDGIAVDSCLIPAPRAHGSEIVTIEGLAQGDNLHPVQQAFVDEGAVQCGYCTPGFIMAAASLLDEHALPDQNVIRHGLTGCLCRCTGYYKIVSAIEKAALTMVGTQHFQEESRRKG
jgi:carbon-monoxide dehydrogenase medium subunit